MSKQNWFAAQEKEVVTSNLAFAEDLKVSSKSVKMLKQNVTTPSCAESMRCVCDVPSDLHMPCQWQGLVLESGWACLPEGRFMQMQWEKQLNHLTDKVDPKLQLPVELEKPNKPQKTCHKWYGENAIVSLRNTCFACDFLGLKSMTRACFVYRRRAGLHVTLQLLFLMLMSFNGSKQFVLSHFRFFVCAFATLHEPPVVSCVARWVCSSWLGIVLGSPPPLFYFNFVTVCSN